MRRILAAGLGLVVFGGCASILGDDFKIGPAGAGDGSLGAGDGSSGADGAVDGAGPGDGTVAEGGADGGGVLSCSRVAYGPKDIDPESTMINPQDNHPGGAFRNVYVRHTGLNAVRLIATLNNQGAATSGQSLFRYWNYQVDQPVPPFVTVAKLGVGQNGSVLDVQPIAGGIGVLTLVITDPGTPLPKTADLMLYTLLDSDTSAQAPVPIRLAPLTSPLSSVNDVRATFAQGPDNSSFVWLASAVQDQMSPPLYAGHGGAGLDAGVLTMLPSNGSYYSLGVGNGLPGQPMIPIATGAVAFVTPTSTNGGGAPTGTFTRLLSFDGMSIRQEKPLSPAAPLSSVLSVSPAVTPGHFDVAVLEGDVNTQTNVISDVVISIGDVTAAELDGLSTAKLAHVKGPTDTTDLTILGASHWFGDHFLSVGAGFVLSDGGDGPVPSPGVNVLMLDRMGNLLAQNIGTNKALFVQGATIQAIDTAATEDKNVFDVVYAEQQEQTQGGPNGQYVAETLKFARIQCQ